MDIRTNLHTAEQAIGNLRADLLLVKLHCRPELVPLVRNALSALSKAGAYIEEAARHDELLEQIDREADAAEHTRESADEDRLLGGAL